MKPSHLLYQLEMGKLKPGEAEQYLAEKLRLREGLFTMNHPLSTISFNHYLLEGLPQEWATFKEVHISRLSEISETTLIPAIQTHDDEWKKKNERDMAYAVRIPHVWFQHLNSQRQLALHTL